MSCISVSAEAESLGESSGVGSKTETGMGSVSIMY